MAPRIIYKICSAAEWQAARARGAYTGAPVDQADGFIHFSTAGQVAETARRHFAGRDGLVLVAVDAAGLGPPLRWEPSRGGDLFPHLYAALPADKALAVHDLPLGPDGRHKFPPLEDEG